MQELTDLNQVSAEDRTTFGFYVMVISKLQKFIDSIIDHAPDVIFDELYDTKLRIGNHFIAFVKGLKPEQR